MPKACLKRQEVKSDKEHIASEIVKRVIDGSSQQKNSYRQVFVSMLDKLSISYDQDEQSYHELLSQKLPALVDAVYHQKWSSRKQERKKI